MFGLDPNKKARSVAVDINGAIMQGQAQEQVTVHQQFAAGAAVLNMDLLSGTVSGWFDAQGFNSGSWAIITGAGLTAGTITFEQTNEPTLAGAGVPWMVVDLSAATTSQGRTTSHAPTASAIKIMAAPLQCRYIRFRCSAAFAGGTVQVVSSLSPATYFDLSTYGIQGVLNEGVTGGTSVFPVPTAGLVRTATINFAANQQARLTMSAGGALVNMPYAVPDLQWQFTSAVTTTTSALAAKAAGAAGIRNYVTSIQAQNTSATATTLLIQDGATAIWQCNLPASMAIPVTVALPGALRGTAATALNYNFGTAGATVLLNVQGFQSP